MRLQFELSNQKVSVQKIIFFDKLVDSIKQKENDFRKTDCNPFFNSPFFNPPLYYYQMIIMQGQESFIKRGLLPMPTSHREIALSNDFLQLVSKFYQDLEY